MFVFSRVAFFLLEFKSRPPYLAGGEWRGVRIEHCVSFVRLDGHLLSNLHPPPPPSTPQKKKKKEREKRIGYVGCGWEVLFGISWKVCRVQQSGKRLSGVVGEGGIDRDREG